MASKPHSRRKRLTLRGLQASALAIIRDHYRPAQSQATEQTLLQDAGFDQTYSVGELTHNEDKKNTLYFVDPHKNITKYWVYMVDAHDHGALPLASQKPCMWDRNPFHTRPIGIPIEYHQHEASGPKKLAREVALVESNLPADTNDFFVTTGIVCSFPCGMAVVRDRANDERYRDSATLFTLLYLKLMGGDGPAVIPTAGPWTMIKPYGHLHVDEFRQTFGKLEYIETPNIRRPYMYSCADVTQEVAAENA